MNYISKYPDVDILYSPCDIVSDVGHTQKCGNYNWPEYSHETLLQMCICGPFPCIKRKSIIDG